jgi:aminotransferase
MRVTETGRISAGYRARPIANLALIDLALGGPVYPPPKEAQASAARVLVDGYHAGRYTSREGLPHLRTRLAQRTIERYGMPGDDAWVTITDGASMGLAAAILVLSQPGDIVACPDPGYPAYRPLSEQLGRRVLSYQAPAYDKDDGFVYRSVSGVVDAGARIVIWNSPGNPTGTVVSRGLSAAIGELARDRDVMVLSDESYEDIVFEGHHVSPLTAAPHNVCALYSFSKSFGLAGWRVGYVVATPTIVDAISHVHFSLAMSVPTLSQFAALGALAAHDSYRVDLVEGLREVRNAASVALSNCGVPHRRPSGTYFLWLDIRGTGLSSAMFAERSLHEARVALMPGHIFGAAGEGFVRLNFAAMPDAVYEGCKRVGSLFEQFRGRQRNA